MERFFGLSDYGILPIIGFGVIVFLLVTAFKGSGKGGGNSKSSGSSNDSSTPTA